MNSNGGNALGQLGKIDDALKSYDKLIQLKPDSAEAYSGRGNILEKLGQLDEALQSYNKAIPSSLILQRRTLTEAIYLAW